MKVILNKYVGKYVDGNDAVVSTISVDAVDMETAVIQMKEEKNSLEPKQVIRSEDNIVAVYPELEAEFSVLVDEVEGEKPGEVYPDHYKGVKKLSKVIFTAVPKNSDYRFVKWTNESKTKDLSTDPVAELVITDDITVFRAIFERIQ